MDITLSLKVLDLLAQAAEEVVKADSVAHATFVEQAGHLVLEVAFYPDGMFASFIDETYHCWDHCGGIVTFHRSGWCRFNPEHADFDCACMEGFYQAEYEAWLDEQEDLDHADFGPLTAVDALAAEQIEEPF